MFALETQTMMQRMQHANCPDRPDCPNYPGYPNFTNCQPVHADHVNHAKATLEICNIVELSSAQQRMRTLVVSGVRIQPLGGASASSASGQLGQWGQLGKGGRGGGGDGSNGKCGGVGSGGSDGSDGCGHSQNNNREYQWEISFPISLHSNYSNSSNSARSAMENAEGSYQTISESHGSQPRHQHMEQIPSSNHSTESIEISHNLSDLDRIINSLRESKNKIVLREWRHGASWWNLNMNHELECAATADNVANPGEIKHSKQTLLPVIRGSAQSAVSALSALPATDGTQAVATNGVRCNEEEGGTRLNPKSNAGKTVVSMARAEVAGYRLARMAMEYYNENDLSLSSDGILCNGVNNIHPTRNHGQKLESRGGERASVFMPEVLYFSHDPYYIDTLCQQPLRNLGIDNSTEVKSCIENINAPWALLSHFGNESGNDDGESGCVNINIDIDSNLGLDWHGILDDIGKESGFVIANGNSAANLEYGSKTRKKNSSHEETPSRGEPLPRRNKSYPTPCNHFPTTMTKIRHEFGFDEPHPRHGRVPTDECLDYALMVLRDVVLPVQRSFFEWHSCLSDQQIFCPSKDVGINNVSRIVNNNLFSLGWCNSNETRQKNGKIKTFFSSNPFQYQDMVSVYRHALNRLSAAHARNKLTDSSIGNGHKAASTHDERMEFLLNMLDKCVNSLGREWHDYGGQPPLLPFTVCHMDLQPQNLAFCHHAQGIESSSAGNLLCNERHSHISNQCSVASVMDWEEACYADPRFEILLLCRKVLANRSQADALWTVYSKHVERWGSNPQSKGEMEQSSSAAWKVGPIEPWLRLETVHSLCTLLLQAMDLLGGGRNPWESKPDLWGKIDRERQRLVMMGWGFCTLSEADGVD